MQAYRLIILIGVPGSGKSSIAAQWQQWQPSLVISTDRIRANLFGDEATQGDWPQIWQQVQQQLREAIVQMQTEQISLAIYDATNARRRSRRQIVSVARTIGFSWIGGVWLNPPLDICLQRNRQRTRQVPPPIVQRMYYQLRSHPPRLREGFDRIWCLNSAQLELEAIAAQQCQLLTEQIHRSSTEIAPVHPQ